MRTLFSIPCAIGVVFIGGLLGDLALAQEPMDIKTFVRQTFIHGVPYEEASKYDARVVPTLLNMLADRGEETHWPNIVVTLGIIGDEKAVGPLIEFLTAGEGEISHSQYIAKSSVPMALGYLINKSASERALAYVKESLDPAVWARRHVRWLSPYHETGKGRNVQLSTMAILGLALSGHPSAREALLGLQKAAATEAGKEFQAQVSDVVTLALRDHEIIAKEGLVGYYRKRRGPAAVPSPTVPPPIVTGRPAPPPPPPPAMQKPQLPPVPALAAPVRIPQPSLPGPPPIKDGSRPPQGPGSSTEKD